ncbi:YihY/virulence factor BrkB family protein [Corynebacterium jeikeium]|uniref:YihY/virulence factor BrkB family protein n=1 Tax=Corynebacterium jeikeium TaxID=38289 RepID=UPI0023583E3E|nr:YihY/virulence factor BrkB family protein [Corynebacterium jeikeium]
MIKHPTNFPDNAQSIVSTVIGSTEQSIVMLVISVLLALFSSSAYLRAFSRMSNEMYGRREGRGLIRRWTTMWAVTLVLVIGLVFIAGAYFLREDIARPLLDKVAEPLRIQGFTTFVLEHFLPVWQYLRWPVIFFVSAILIAILYHVAPNVRFGRVRWLTVGSTFALISITIVGLLLRAYLNNFGYIGIYGALGGIIVSLPRLGLKQLPAAPRREAGCGDRPHARAAVAWNPSESSRFRRAPPQRWRASATSTTALRNSLRSCETKRRPKH